MTLREEIVTAARSWLGTKYVHQQRMKGVAVDCAGLVIGVAREVGLVDATFDVNGYSRQPDGSLITRCNGLLEPVYEMQPGDVVVMSFQAEPNHLAIAGSYRGSLSIIHALCRAGGRGKVVEHRLDRNNMRKIIAAYKFKGVE